MARVYGQCADDRLTCVAFHQSRRLRPTPFALGCRKLFVHQREYGAVAQGLKRLGAAVDPALDRFAQWIYPLGLSLGAGLTGRDAYNLRVPTRAGFLQTLS